MPMSARGIGLHDFVFVTVAQQMSISPVNTHFLFLFQPRSPVNFPTNQSLTQLSSVSQCRNSSISWALVSALLMKSPHHVNQHRKLQLHVQSQEMQVMDL